MIHAAPHDIVKRVLYYVGTGALVVGFLMTFEFGRSMSWLHAAAMGLLTIAAAFIWSEIDRLWRTNRGPTAIVLAIAGVFFIAVELFSHLGYTVGHRIRDTEEATVQNTAYNSAQESIEDGKASLAMWRKQLEELKAQNAWATTVTAEGLRAQVEPAKFAIELESRRGGCKSRCLDRKRDLAAIEDKIAVAEQVSDLSKRIAATEAVLDKKRDTGAKTEFRTSKIISQTKFVSQLATFELEPGKGAMTWAQIGIGFAIALVTTFMAPVCFFLANRDPEETPRERHYQTPSHGHSAVPHAVNAHVMDTGAERGQAGNSSLSVIRQTVHDHGTARLIADACAPFRAKFA